MELALVIVALVACSSVSPPYSAVTDLAVRPEPALPAIGPAGSQFQDPTFHSRILRVTDPETRPDRPGDINIGPIFLYSADTLQVYNYRSQFDSLAGQDVTKGNRGYSSENDFPNPAARLLESIPPPAQPLKVLKIKQIR